MGGHILRHKTGWELGYRKIKASYSDISSMSREEAYLFPREELQISLGGWKVIRSRCRGVQRLKHLNLSNSLRPEH